MSTSAVFALKVVPRGGAGRLRLRGKVRHLRSLAQGYPESEGAGPGTCRLHSS